MELPAAGAPIVKDDGAGDVLRQYPFDLPHQLLAFLQVALHRLLLDQPVYLRIAVTVIIQLGTAPVAQVEVLVWVLPASRLVVGDDVVLRYWQPDNAVPGDRDHGVSRGRCALAREPRR